MTLPTITAPVLERLPGIRHAFFTREGGVSTGIYASLNAGIGSRDDQAKVAENRRRMAEALGVEPSHFLTAYQVHSADAVIATGPWVERPHVDAVATAMPGLAVGISIADCGPVLFADPEARVVAAAHAGWKGAVGGVLEATLARMEELGARRERTVAVLGPCIRQPSYEVSQEFVDRFSADDRIFFIPSKREGHALFDLGGYIGRRLRAAGVGVFEDIALDTYSDEARFFSYRRTTHRNEEDYGRLVAAIVIEA
jgi:YfiH family protein